MEITVHATSFHSTFLLAEERQKVTGKVLITAHPGEKEDIVTERRLITAL